MQNAQWKYGELLERGDINCGNQINTTNLEVLKKLVAGLIDTNDSSVFNSHVNDDRVINTTDLAILKKLVAGLV